MFDIKNIVFKVATNTDYSFVGLKRVAINNLEFWLPKGFETFNKNNNFEGSKDFFFKMYRTFQVYQKNKKNNSQISDRDGIIESADGFSFRKENQDEIIFYGKLKALDKILDGYDDLQIDSLEKKEMRSNAIDYSKIHRYMHQAVYLEEDVIYLDEMNIAKNVLVQTSPSIIQLFCFIYTEVKTELEALENVPNKAFELADKFKQTYLQPNSSLFAADTFADTIHILKAVFDDIGNKTTYKDEDFWHFYDAIEVFLKGEEQYDKDGIYFGINQFYDVWEDMCQTVMIEVCKDEILFADERIDKFGKPHPYELKLNQKGKSRYIKPDLVLKLDHNYFSDKEIEDKFHILYDATDKPFSWHTNKRVTLKVDNVELNNIYNKFVNFKPDIIFEGNFLNFVNEVVKLVKNNLDLQRKLDLLKIRIIDYKYMSISDFQNYKVGDTKLTMDIQKQLLYEWAIQQHDDYKNYKTESEFWLPFELDKMEKPEDITDITDLTSDDFQQSGIKVKKVNFKHLQDFYVKSSK